MLIMDPEEREIKALRQLVTLDGMAVLDIGCGEGRTARRIARTAASVIGVDPDADRIAVAREAAARDGASNLTFLDEDVVTFDFRNEQFDAVVFTRSL